MEDDNRLSGAFNEAECGRMFNILSRLEIKVTKACLYIWIMHSIWTEILQLRNTRAPGISLGQGWKSKVGFPVIDSVAKQ